jgi:hypothetical protein
MTNDVPLPAFPSRDANQQHWDDWIGLGVFDRTTTTSWGDAIPNGARRYPELTLISGDFFQVDIPGPFDFILSAMP